MLISFAKQASSIYVLPIRRDIITLRTHPQSITTWFSALTFFLLPPSSFLFLLPLDDLQLQQLMTRPVANADFAELLGFGDTVVGLGHVAAGGKSISTKESA